MSGNTVRFEATAQGHLMREELVRLGGTILTMNRWLDGERAQGVYMISLKVRMPTEGRSDCLVVVQAQKGNQRLVGFHSADTPAEAVRGAIARVENGTMIWRGDSYEVEEGAE